MYINTHKIHYNVDKLLQNIIRGHRGCSGIVGPSRPGIDHIDCSPLVTSDPFHKHIMSSLTEILKKKI